MPEPVPEGIERSAEAFNTDVLDREGEITKCR